MITLKSVSAIEKGMHHEIQEMPCQDAVASTWKGKIFAAVLCDGAGSVKHSEIASKGLSAELCKYVANNFQGLCLLNEEEVRKTLVKKSQSILEGLELPFKDASCTLQCLAIDTENDELLYFHIGDGGCFVRKYNDKDIFSYPKNGKYVNETYFLNNFAAELHLEVKKISIEHDMQFLLTTDGCWYTLYDAMNKKIANAVDKMLDWIKDTSEQEAVEILQAQLHGILKKHTDDDMGVVLVDIQK